MSIIAAASQDAIQKAASILTDGGLVAFPTETVYGLGANALDGKAVARIFEAKGRPAFNPLIVHYLSLEDAAQDVVAPDFAKELAAHFWPGPLTMILPRARERRVSELASAGLPTLAVRVPAHETARKLIKTCGFPLAAPSANRSGSLSPTSPQHVADSLGGAVDMILAGGTCAVGLESTVIDLSADEPVILRPGGVTAEDIERATGLTVFYDGGDHGKPRSPGQLLKHYAPKIPVRLNAVDVSPNEALLAFGSVKFMGVRGGGFAKDLPTEKLKNLSETGDLYEAASNLFSMLHALDKSGASAIAVMNVPDQGVGIAINDRLKRAANA